MKRIDWKALFFDESNLLIWVPATVTILLLALFTVYGLQEPDNLPVPVTSTIMDYQDDAMTTIMDRFQNGNYTPEIPLVVQDPFGISPLTAMILFETDTEESFVISIAGKDGQADLVYHTDSATNHIVPIYGLYPDFNNTVRVYEYNDKTKDMGTLLTSVSLRTKPLPDRVVLPTSLSTTDAYFGMDWMVLTPGENNLPAAYDAKGNVRWYLTIPTSFVFEEMSNGHFLVGGEQSYGAPYYKTALYEIDYLGRIYTTFLIPGGFHHDAVELPNGNLLVLSSSKGDTVDDIVIEVSRATGEIVREYDLSQLIDTTQGRAEMGTDSDWFHATSIDYNEMTDAFLVTGRHQDIIVNIDRSTGTINYMLGNPNNWNPITVNGTFLVRTDQTPKWFYAPYDAVFVPGGDVLVFDNGNNRSKMRSADVPASENYSRAVLYDINTNSFRATEVDAYGEARGWAFYSPYLSNVRYYGTDHYLIHSGGIASTVDGALNTAPSLYDGERVVTKTSVTVEVEDGIKRYELKMPDHFARATRIDPTVYQTIHMNPRRTLGYQPITPLVVGKIDTKISLFQKMRLEYDVTFVKASDRLVLSGLFASDDVVYLELENNLGVRRYLVPTAPITCTELCLVPESAYTTFYVNEAGVIGTFDLYIRVNGHRYDADQHVTFD